jgi:hypothetical protein
MLTEKYRNKKHTYTHTYIMNNKQKKKEKIAPPQQTTWTMLTKTSQE